MGIPHLGDSWCSRVYYVESSQQSCMNKTNLTLEFHTLIRPQTHVPHNMLGNASSWSPLSPLLQPWLFVWLFPSFKVHTVTRKAVQKNLVVVICIHSHSIQETFLESVYLHYDLDTLNCYYIPNPEVGAIKKLQKQVHHSLIFFFFSLSSKESQARLLVTCLEYHKIHVVWNTFFRNWGGMSI